ncbi:hypothetical protein ACFFRR_009498 [Megaselia abdita]
MKIYPILVISSLLVAFTAGVSEEVLVKMLEQIRSACHPKFPDLPEEVLDKLRMGFEPEFASNSLKCYGKCVLQYLGVLTKKGDINKGKATAKLLLILPDELHPLGVAGVDKCIGVQNDYKDSCDKVWYFSICVKHFDERLFNSP